MKLLNSFCFALSSLCALSLHSAVEYDIIPLQPADHIPTSALSYSIARDLTESGFITGELSLDVIDEDDWRVNLKSFVYHPIRGFEWIDLDGEVDPRAINEKGLVAGILDGSKIFVYDSEEKQLVGAFDHQFFGMPGQTYFAGCSILNEGNVLVKIYDPNELTFVFDANHPENPPKEISNEIVSMSNAGNMISETKFYKANGESYDLGYLDPYARFSVIAQALNDNDVVAGVGYDVNDDMVGFIWDPVSGIRSLGNFGGYDMDVYAINSLSQVVGFAEDDSLKEKAFFFDETSGLKNLGTLGGKYSAALDINDASQVVGMSTTSKKSELDHAFIWDEEHGMRDLNTLIPKNSGWKVLESAHRINNNGSIIGSGWYRGEPMDFLMIPRAQ